MSGAKFRSHRRDHRRRARRRRGPAYFLQHDRAPFRASLPHQLGGPHRNRHAAGHDHRNKRRGRRYHRRTQLPYLTLCAATDLVLGRRRCLDRGTRGHHRVDPAEARTAAAVDAHVLVDKVAVEAAHQLVRFAQQEARNVLHVLVHVDDQLVLLVVVHQVDRDHLDVNPVERNGLEDLWGRGKEKKAIVGE